MSEAHTGADVRDVNLHEIGSASRGAAWWLGLAAAPTFAIMALLTGILGGGRMAMMCSSLQDASPLGGMVLMYLLMSAFHLAPWLKLISGGPGQGRRRGAKGWPAPPLDRAA